MNTVNRLTLSFAFAIALVSPFAFARLCAATAQETATPIPLAAASEPPRITYPTTTETFQPAIRICNDTGCEDGSSGPIEVVSPDCAFVWPTPWTVTTAEKQRSVKIRHSGWTRLIWTPQEIKVWVGLTPGDVEADKGWHTFLTFYAGLAREPADAEVLALSYLPPERTKFTEFGTLRVISKRVDGGRHVESVPLLQAFDAGSILLRWKAGRWRIETDWTETVTVPLSNTVRLPSGVDFWAVAGERQHVPRKDGHLVGRGWEFTYVCLRMN